MKLTVLVVLLFCSLCVAQEWIQLSSLFGVAKPFRQGHSAAMTTFGRMVSFSGLDNTLTGSPSVTRFNYLTTSQLQILQENPATNKLSRQLCGYDTWNDEKLVIYGGLVGGIASKELLIFDIAGGTWVDGITTTLDNEAFNIENHWKFPAESPSAAIDQATGYLWLFGGRSTILNLNFITKVDLTTYTFYQVNISSANNQPSRRHGAVMAFYDDDLFVFGGRNALGDDSQPHEYYNQLYRFTGTSWNEPTTGGPSARAYSATALRKNGQAMILFGGQNLNTPFNDVWSLNLNNGAWTEINPSGTEPSIRSKSAAVSLVWGDEDSILFYGGADNLGGSLNDFWKLEFVSTGGGPVDPPTTLDQDADVTDELTGTTAPPAPTSTSTQQQVLDLVEDGAASGLLSWCSCLWA